MNRKPISLCFSAEPVEFSSGPQTLILRLPDWQRAPGPAELRRILNCALSRPEALPGIACLDLDFLLLAFCARSGACTISAGPRDSMQWWLSERDDAIAVSETAPKGDVDPRALGEFLACGAAFGPFDLSRQGGNFYTGYIRVSHGDLLHRADYDAEFRRSSPEWISDADDVSAETAKENIRGALDAHLKNALRAGPVAIEASGGIDSGLVLSRAQKLAGGKPQVFGVAASYPYREFGFERGYRQRLAKHVGTEIFESASPALPFEDLGNAAPHSHPAWLSASWKQTHAITKLAERHGARTLLSGHGGDRLFLSDPFQTTAHNMRAFEAPPVWLGRALRAEIEARIEDLHREAPQGWNASHFEPGWLVSEVMEPRSTPFRYSGLLSREILSAMQSVWRAAPEIPAKGQKPLARWLFEEDLPTGIWERPGKIDHLGLSYRGALLFGGDVHALAQKHSGALSEAGVQMRPFLKTLKRFARGQDVGNRYINGIVSFVTWLERRNQTQTPPISRTLSMTLEEIDEYS